MRFKFTSELTGHYSNQVEITIDLTVKVLLYFHFRKHLVLQNEVDNA